MKGTAIIPIRVGGQGGQWKSIYILTAGSSSFQHALASQLLECGWSEAEESSSFCVLTSQLSKWLEQGSGSLVEGHCLWNQTLRRFLGSWSAFQVSLSQEVAAFWTLVWWIQGLTPVPLTAVCVARTTEWGPVPTGWNGFSFPLIFNPYLISWLIGMDPIAQRNGCAF